MKFKFDLLPDEYRSLPRDILGIALAVLTIVGSFSAITSMHIKTRGERVKIEEQISEVEKELTQIINDTGKLQPPVNDIKSLINSIEFINNNLDTPGTNLVDFLAAFESTIPTNVTITDINPKAFTGTTKNFIVTGKATSVFDVTDFVRRMNDSGKFKAFLRRNNLVKQDGTDLTSFILEFIYTPLR